MPASNASIAACCSSDQGEGTATDVGGIDDVELVDATESDAAVGGAESAGSPLLPNGST